MYIVEAIYGSFDILEELAACAVVAAFEHRPWCLVEFAKGI